MALAQKIVAKKDSAGNAIPNEYVLEDATPMEIINPTVNLYGAQSNIVRLIAYSLIVAFTS